jgi:hypothetical protein
METQLGKIAESQTLILTRFAGKPEPNPVEELKMMHIEKEELEELDYSMVGVVLISRSYLTMRTIIVVVVGSSLLTGVSISPVVFR